MRKIHQETNVNFSTIHLESTTGTNVCHETEEEKNLVCVDLIEILKILIYKVDKKVMRLSRLS